MYNNLYNLKDRKLKYDLSFLNNLILDSTFEAVYNMLLPTGEYLYMSDSSKDIFGYEPEEWYKNNKFLSEIIHPDWKNHFHKEWKKSLIAESNKVYEYQIIHKNGSTRWVNQRNYCEKDENGNNKSISGIITDITKYKVAQEKHIESEKRFYDFFYLSPDPILIMEDNKFIDCNQAAVDFLNFDSKEYIINTHPSFISPIKQPDGKSSYDKANDLISVAKENGKNRFNWVHKKADGMELFVEVTLTNIYLNDKDVFHVHLKDISKLKNIEEELEENRLKFLEYAQTSFDWVWEVDSDGIYTFVSSRVIDFLGYTPQEIIGTSPFELMSDKEAKRVGELFTDYLSKEKTFNFLLNENIHKNGNKVYLETSGVPIYNSNGEFIGYRGTDRDVTQSINSKHSLEKIVLQHKAVVETMQDGYWVADIQGNMLEVNDAYCKMTGYTKDACLSMNILDFEAQETPQETKEHIEKIIETGCDTFETKQHKKNGVILDVEIITSFSTIEGGRFFTFVRDISDRKKAEYELTLSAQVYSSMTDGVVITDKNQNIIRMNDAFLKITEYSEEDLLGKKPSLISSGWHDEEFYNYMWNDLNKKGQWQGEIVDRKKSGAVYTSETSIVAIKDTKGEISNYIAVSSDISDKKEKEKIINNLAYYDVLTNLPNKLYFQEQFNSRIAVAKRAGKKIALMFIDLDNFKGINDTFGHLVGDQFLKEASVRIKTTIREEDIFGRFGGDEFAILVEDFNKLSDLGILSQKIIDIFNEPFILNNTNVYSGASIGISIYPDNGKTYTEVLRTADTAMYYVKETGKGGYKFYLQSMNDKISNRMLLESALVTALHKNEFHLVYQPKVNVEENNVFGMEALLRWNNPSIGFVGPDIFIPIAEDNGKIYQIGLFVIKQALIDTKKLHKIGKKIVVSINVSIKQLENDNFIYDLKSIIDEVGVLREYVELEITENQVMKDIDVTLLKLNEITNSGINISIDDFGTGYSSLSYLKKLPADIIKIDKSFVLDINDDEDNKAIVSAIIAMAKSLNKNIIAEGSETKEHIDTLLELGCKNIQGYYFSKPLVIDEFTKYITNFR
jgi:diguanylate cyclase (GGDEF)-like protein/PAS domain S-box-containing protein